MQLGNPQRRMLRGTVLSMLSIAATPLLGAWFGLLLFQFARGWLEGVIQPVILPVQARAVGCHRQGAVVGLRQTGQWLSSILIPPRMSGISRPLRNEPKLSNLPAFMLSLCGLLALIIRRRNGLPVALVDGALVSFIAPSWHQNLSQRQSHRAHSRHRPYANRIGDRASGSS
jgi:hypothetical protein